VKKHILLSDISCSFFKADGQTQSINSIYWKGINQNTVAEPVYQPELFVEVDGLFVM